MSYRCRAAKPTAALWIVVLAADVVLAMNSFGVTVLAVALAGTLAVTTVLAGRVVLHRRGGVFRRGTPTAALRAGTRQR